MKAAKKRARKRALPMKYEIRKSKSDLAFLKMSLTVLSRTKKKGPW
jgi:hypothetical protein